jgi:hypothetical protein
MLIFFIIIIYIFVLIVQGPKYYPYYPTLPIYPNNKVESQEVLSYMKRRNKYYENLFYVTDDSVANAFQKIVNEPLIQLNLIATEKNFYIRTLKNIFNRARPEQVNKQIKVLNSKTAQTPAYPSGHAFQAYFLAKVLSKKYRNKVKELWKLADDCNMARVYAGLHYLSDGEFSKRLVKKYF